MHVFNIFNTNDDILEYTDVYEDAPNRAMVSRSAMLVTMMLNLSREYDDDPKVEDCVFKDCNEGVTTDDDSPTLVTSILTVSKASIMLTLIQ